MKAIIIDDEIATHKSLEKLLASYSINLTIVGKAYDLASGKQLIDECQPQLVFLDISFPNGQLGFDLLLHYPNPSFQLIFMSASSEYALQAVRFGALEYLLKPIDPDLLKKVIAIAARRLQEQNSYKQQLKVMMEAIQKLQHKELPTRITISTSEGIFFKAVEDIVRFEAKEGYTSIVFTEGQKNILASINLGEYEEQFRSYPEFVRVHRSHMVNLKYVDRYIKSDGGYLLLHDGQSVLVSKGYKNRLIDRMEDF